jgi:hypothetical protein
VPPLPGTCHTSDGRLKATGVCFPNQERPAGWILSRFLHLARRFGATIFRFLSAWLWSGGKIQGVITRRLTNCSGLSSLKRSGRTFSYSRVPTWVIAVREGQLTERKSNDGWWSHTPNVLNTLLTSQAEETWCRHRVKWFQWYKKTLEGEKDYILVSEECFMVNNSANELKRVTPIYNNSMRGLSANWNAIGQSEFEIRSTNVQVVRCVEIDVLLKLPPSAVSPNLKSFFKHPRVKPQNFKYLIHPLNLLSLPNSLACFTHLGFVYHKNGADEDLIFNQLSGNRNKA